MTEPIKYIDMDEFRDAGYLQEANRQFFHPLGLALEWHPGWTFEELEKFIAEKGIRFGLSAIENVWTGIRLLGLDKPYLSGVWDDRDDPEGTRYGPGLLSEEKAVRVINELQTKAKSRYEALGYIGQPFEYEQDD